MSRYRTLTNSTQDRRDQALEEHRAIVAAISAREPDLAGRLARDHVLAARDQAIRVISRGDFVSGASVIADIDRRRQ